MVNKAVMKSNVTTGVLAIVLLTMALFFLYQIGVFETPRTEDTNANDDRTVPADVTDAAEEVRVTDDGVRYTVHPSELRSGGPPKGGIGVDTGIPALAEDNINFVSVQQADEWIADNELVGTITHNGETRAYPLQILVFHEIANDRINGDPVLITYCPLCGSVIGFERTITVNGTSVETAFGVSGKLRNSNLVMYDAQTETYWQQIGGNAIVGQLTGQELEPLDMQTVSWGQWKDDHPDAQVLSRNTGFNRPYGDSPYGNYKNTSNLLFPVDNQDNTIDAKTIVFGIEVNGTFKAYRENDIAQQGTIEDTVGSVPVYISQKADGSVIITNQNTGEVVPKDRSMWFAWHAFHPETELYAP